MGQEKVVFTKKWYLKKRQKWETSRLYTFLRPNFSLDGVGWVCCLVTRPAMEVYMNAKICPNLFFFSFINYNSR